MTRWYLLRYDYKRFGFLHLHVVSVEDVIFDVVEGPEVETEDVGDGDEPH